MAVPLRLRFTQQRTPVAEGRAIVSVGRVECVLAMPLGGFGFVLTGPFGVTFSNAGRSRFTPVVDSALVTWTIVLIALLAAAWFGRGHENRARAGHDKGAKQ